MTKMTSTTTMTTGLEGLPHCYHFRVVGWAVLVRRKAWGFLLHRPCTFASPHRSWHLAWRPPIKAAVQRGFLAMFPFDASPCPISSRFIPIWRMMVG